MKLIVMQSGVYDLPEAKFSIEELKLQSGFDSDCSLAVMKGVTLPTPLALAKAVFNF